MTAAVRVRRTCDHDENPLDSNFLRDEASSDGSQNRAFEICLSKCIALGGVKRTNQGSQAEQSHRKGTILFSEEVTNGSSAACDGALPEQPAGLTR